MPLSLVTGDQMLREYTTTRDMGAMVTRLEHNISEFVKHYGEININLYEVRNLFYHFL